jgi:hypothetical protein
MNVDHWHMLQNFLRDDVAKCNNNAKQTIWIQPQYIVDVVRDRYSKCYGNTLDWVRSCLRTSAPSLVNARNNKFDYEPFCNERL